MNWNKIDPATFTNNSKIFQYAQVVSNSKQRIKENEYFSLIDQHAFWIKSKQDDKTISLNYESYQNDLNKSKLQNDKLKIIEDFTSPYLFEWNESNTQTSNTYKDDMQEKRNRWLKSLEKDIYINEAVNLLKDLSLIDEFRILSQAKID